MDDEEDMIITDEDVVGANELNVVTAESDEAIDELVGIVVGAGDDVWLDTRLVVELA